MGAIIHSSSIIKDIVIKLPKVSGILKEYKIDFCCGGNRPLGEAIKENNLNEHEVLTRLNEISQNQQYTSTAEFNVEQASNGELIDYIIQTHHAYLGEVLPELSQYVTKIFRVHGNSHPELSQVYKLFHEMRMELEKHIIEEEETVFPLIAKYQINPTSSQLNVIVKVVESLEQDHQAVGKILNQLRNVTQEYLLPEDACTTYTVTYRKLEELESDIFQHIHLENNILFQRLSSKSLN